MFYPDIPYDHNLQFVLFDIINMYSNVPTDEQIKITNSICLKQGINDKHRHELISISCTIIKQNYFQFQNTFYIQETELTMVSPTSSIFFCILLATRRKQPHMMS
jgi:hypothetical protein